MKIGRWVTAGLAATGTGTGASSVPDSKKVYSGPMPRPYFPKEARPASHLNSTIPPPFDFGASVNTHAPWARDPANSISSAILRKGREDVITDFATHQFRTTGHLENTPLNFYRDAALNSRKIESRYRWGEHTPTDQAVMRVVLEPVQPAMRVPRTPGQDRMIRDFETIASLMDPTGEMRKSGEIAGLVLKQPGGGLAMEEVAYRRGGSVRLERNAPGRYVSSVHNHDDTGTSITDPPSIPDRYQKELAELQARQHGATHDFERPVVVVPHTGQKFEVSGFPPVTNELTEETADRMPTLPYCPKPNIY